MSSAEKQLKPRRRKPRAKSDKLLSAIDKEKQILQIPKMDPQEVHVQMWEQGDQSEKLTKLFEHIDKISSDSIQRMRESAGLKVLDAWSQKTMGSSYSKLTQAQKREFLHYVLADDLGQVASQVLKHASPLVLNYVWNKIKNTPLVSKARSVLRDYFGIDTNDDVPLSVNRFVVQPHQTSWIQPQDVGYRYDAVCTQAIASMLFPELTQCRIPSDVALKTGLLNKTQTFTLPTNSSGSAAVVFYPQYFDSAALYKVFNDATFSPSTGTQASVSSPYAGPINGLGSTINTCRLTAFSVLIEPIVSTLNNSGRLVYAMNDFNSTIPSNVTLPFNTASCRDAQYCLYGSVAGSSGHRLVYDNSSVADETFSIFGANREYDAIQIIVEGAQPNTAILQISYTYQIEYTINGGSSILIEKSPPPIGPATLKAYDAAISMRPDLRIIGRQEAVQLYSAMVDQPPYYSALLKMLTNYQFTHTYSEVLLQRGQSEQQAESDSFQSDFTVATA